jgi:hypothetical protein
MAVAYPYVPKTTRDLKPGDYWEIPLDGGGYACGRVVQLSIDPQTGRRDRVSFLAGLMDWFGLEMPTERILAKKRIVEQGNVHVKTIRETGGMIRGNRSLALDGLSPWIFRTAEYGRTIQCGYYELRDFDADIDSDLPVIGSWGYCHIKDLAEERFKNRRRTRR